MLGKKKERRPLGRRFALGACGRQLRWRARDGDMPK